MGRKRVVLIGGDGGREGVGKSVAAGTDDGVLTWRMCGGVLNSLNPMSSPISACCREPG